MNLNLLLAAFWLVLGFVLVVLPWVNGIPLDLTIRGTGTSAAWIFPLLTVWNLMRWWASRRSASPGRDAAAPANIPTQHIEGNPELVFPPPEDLPKTPRDQ